jgi:hypothetical protein
MATELRQDIDIAEWCRDIIDGPGGMIDQEAHKLVIYHVPDRVAAVMFAVRCLANPRCAGSAEVLAAIGERRADVAPAGGGEMPLFAGLSEE